MFVARVRSAGSGQAGGAVGEGRAAMGGGIGELLGECGRAVVPRCEPLRAGYAVVARCAAGVRAWGGLTVLALMLVKAYLVSRRRVDAERMVAVSICAGVGVVAALLINQQLISPAVARARPCHSLRHVEVLLACGNDYSFPGDHCMMAGAFVAGLAFMGMQWAVPAGVLTILLAFSRVCTGVHHPSDIAGGMLIGAAIGVVVVLLLRGGMYRLTRCIASTRLRVLVSAGSASPARPVRAPSR